ncbi:MAG: response regulator [Maricaulis sp.]|jgi:two-component system response regulator|nr:response regulator [Maricaulis sp.]HAQ34758.1 response regulator [Alphaproteobacteria bacterium]|tara:strand:+ start:519 stop:950 length:432 start_codon:yes stop_codon:yes gene_type:complete
MSVSERKTVLLVEDDDGDAFFAQRAFRKYDHEIDLVRVSGGQDALQYVQRRGPYSDAEPPRCILLDLQMENGDGHWTLKQLNSLYPGLNIPVMVLSASADELELTRDYSFVIGAAEKPDSVQAYDKLLDVIGRLVQVARATAA